MGRLGRRGQHLSDHHMTIERSLSEYPLRPRNMRTDFGYDRRAEGHVGNEMPIHDVDVEPALLQSISMLEPDLVQEDSLGACKSKARKVLIERLC